MTLTTQKTSHISIIIPTLNEGDTLKRLLTSLQSYQDLEIIIADGGSTDQTIEIAQHFFAKVVSTTAGRGNQQNEGAKLATGDILLFLHSDTTLPNDFTDKIKTVLEQPDTVAGAFRLKIDAKGNAYRLIEWGANVRTVLLGLPYGDQALFVMKKTFEYAGGFPSQPLLEDVELVRRLKRTGNVGIVPAYVTTSARRWQKHGTLKTTLINQIILIGYLCGINPHKLGRLYYKPTATSIKDKS